MSKHKSDSKKDNNDGKYQPKATVRHEKIARSKKDEAEAARQKVIDEKIGRASCRERV